MGPKDRTYFLHATLEPERVAWRWGTFATGMGIQTWHLWYDSPFNEHETSASLAGLFYSGVVDLAELHT